LDYILLASVLLNVVLSPAVVWFFVNFRNQRDRAEAAIEIGFSVQAERDALNAKFQEACRKANLLAQAVWNERNGHGTNCIDTCLPAQCALVCPEAQELPLDDPDVVRFWCTNWNGTLCTKAAVVFSWSKLS